MAQKINSKQLKEIYFNTPTPARSFHEPFISGKMKKPKYSLLDSKKYYQKYSEDEIARFEKFFNKHYFHANTETDVAILKKQDKIDFLDQCESDKDFNVSPETEIKTPTPHAEPTAAVNDSVPTYDVPTPAPLLEKSVAANVVSEGGLPLSRLEKDLIEKMSVNVEKRTEDFDLATPEFKRLIETLETPIEALNFTEPKMDEFFVSKKAEANDDDKDVTEDIAHSTDDERLVKEEIVNDTINSDLKFNEEDEDLIYLENLVSSGGNGIMNVASLDSIGNLLDEIVDNEKNQISNYETDIFKANIKLLFDVDPEADLPLPSPVPEYASTLPKPPALQNNEDMDDNVINSPLKADVAVVETKAQDKTEPFQQDESEKEAQDDFTDFIPNKQIKSKSKLYVFDTILIISLLVIVSILLFYFRDLLPFNLPF